MAMNNKMKVLKNEAEQAKYLLKIGGLSMPEAKAKIAPYISAVNEKALELSKEYKVSYKPVSITGYLR